jgi:hypothetical protein
MDAQTMAALSHWESRDGRETLMAVGLLLAWHRAVTPPPDSRAISVRKVTKDVAYRFSGQELRRRRVAADYTITGLGTAIGRCSAAIVQYQSGVTVPSTNAVLRLAAALGCEPGELFERVSPRSRLRRPERVAS